MCISAPNPGERVADVSFDNGSLCVALRDGRKMSVPLTWFPRLLHATPKQRNNWEIAGAGYEIPTKTSVRKVCSAARPL